MHHTYAPMHYQTYRERETSYKACWFFRIIQENSWKLWAIMESSPMSPWPAKTESVPGPQVSTDSKKHLLKKIVPQTLSSHYVCIIGCKSMLGASILEIAYFGKARQQFIRFLWACKGLEQQIWKERRRKNQRFKTVHFWIKGSPQLFQSFFPPYHGHCDL